MKRLIRLPRMRVVSLLAFGGLVAAARQTPYFTNPDEIVTREDAHGALRRDCEI